MVSRGVGITALVIALVVGGGIVFTGKVDVAANQKARSSPPMSIAAPNTENRSLLQSDLQLENVVASELVAVSNNNSSNSSSAAAASTAKCNDTAGDGSRVPLYPCRMDAYRHPYGTCGEKESKIVIEHSKVMGVNKSTRLWPMYPDERLSFPTEHERCHYAMARMLIIFTAVMKELNLKNWFITHGTLLGAARHGGFIPWDVDIDVVMPRSHITLLRKMWRKHFPRDMFLQTEKTESSFHMWTGKERAMRVKDRYSTFQGVRFTMMKRGKKYRMKKWHLGAQIDIIPLERRKGKYKILHHIIDPALINPINETCFENMMVPAPSNITGFLQELYGPNYMDIPKDAIFQGPTTLPCLATQMSPGSAWSLSWKQDTDNRTSPIVEPRGDPHGSFREDFKVPYTLYHNNKG